MNPVSSLSLLAALPFNEAQPEVAQSHSPVRPKEVNIPLQDNVQPSAKPVEAPKQPVDIFALDKAGQFKEMTMDMLLGGSIFNSKNDHDHIAKEKGRIDPRFFLLPKETVREWYYTRYHTWERISKEEYDQKPVGEMRPALFDRHFDFPVDPTNRTEYYKTHAISFLTQELISDIVQVARRILDATTPKDRIVIFGNTPYFVGRAMKYLVSEHGSTYDQRQFIDLPFSGAPNTLSARNAFSSTQDVVTPDRLDHFKNRLQSLGLSKDNPALLEGTTYFVDVIGAGSGPSYTMETILRDYLREDPSSTLPAFEVISLNKMSASEERNMAIASHAAEDGERFELSFPCKATTHFKIPAQVVYLPGHAALDFTPDVCAATRIVPKYNPCYWETKFDYLLKEPLNGMGKIMLEHFDTNVEALVG